MRSFILFSSISSILVNQVTAHAVVTKVIGANGVNTTGFGNIEGVDRDGLDEQDFQIDTSVFKNLLTNPCGETIGGGTVDIAKNLASAETQGKGQLPSLTSDLTINMVLHQVNADGGGPFFAVVNTDATGKDWSAANVTVQAPGAFGLIDGGALDTPFAVQLPAGTTCTGGTNKNACLIRVSNGVEGSIAVGPGPFGSCLAVQNPAASSNTRNNRKNNNKRMTIKKRSSKHRRSRKQTSTSDASLVKKSLRSDDAFVKRMLEVRETLSKRALNLNAVDVNTIKTITGAAIDTPIDLIAGIDSTLPDGGRSTVDTTRALISIQQAENLKEAVRQAIADAMDIITTNSAVKVDNPTTSDDKIEAAQLRAAAALADGSLKSVSVLPLGVIGGEIRGEKGQNALGTQTASDLLAAAKSTPAASTTITSAPAATTTSSSSTRNNASSGKDGFVRLDNEKRGLKVKSSRH